MLDPTRIQAAAANAWSPKEETPPDQPTSAVDDLRNGGTLSRTLPGYRERGPQLEMAQVVEQAILEEKHALLEASTGTGKALDIETPIPTPTGWKRMGDLTTDDFVFDEKGFPTRVITAFDIMHNHKCYEVTFSDGSSLIADAEHEWITYTCTDRIRTSPAHSQARSDIYKAKNFITSDQIAMLDHLIASSTDNAPLTIREATTLIGGHHWSIFQAAREIEPIHPDQRPAHYSRTDLLLLTRNRLARDLDGQRRHNRAYTLVTTEQIATTLTANKAPTRANHAILVANVLTLPEATLPIDPYFLGVWLGDGNSNGNQIKTADPDLIPEIEKAGYTVRSLPSNPYLYAVDDENGKAINRWKTGMTTRLRTLGVLLNKHIPIIYLRASEQQRRALLAGLLDTDGTVNRDGATEFTTTNPQLAQDVRELLCSLGFRPAVYEGRAQLKGKDCGPKWTLAFTTNQQVFQLARKVTTHKERLRNYNPKRNCFRYIINVQQVPSRPVRCIQVESPSHLYLAGRSMIPTHNSLSYLIPAIRSGKKAIISTANKALQEQLYQKDVPFCQKHIQPFDAALLKGKSNYLCLQRFDLEGNEGMQVHIQDLTFKRLEKAVGNNEWNGDFESLPFSISADLRARITVDDNECARRKCPLFKDCYYYQAREQAKNAQIIITNHDLLLLDAQSHNKLLPSHDVVIIDEAHTLEGIATKQFTIEVKASQILSLLALQRVKSHTEEKTREQAKHQAEMLWAHLDTLLPGNGRTALHTSILPGLTLTRTIERLSNQLDSNKPMMATAEEEELYSRTISRCDNLASNLHTLFSLEDQKNHVYYLERVRDHLIASMTPLDVAPMLRDTLFSQENTVICTSATLSTTDNQAGASFTYFKEQTGMDRPDTLTRILPLVFNYQRNALLYLPQDLPEPAYGNTAEAAAYERALAERIRSLVEASQGRAFLLFSSRRILGIVAEYIAPDLRANDYNILIQGEVPTAELIKQFRNGNKAVLFGLKTFWEGVDIPGEALSLVVIDKLPFPPMDDPVVAAKLKYIERAKRNAFTSYSLPAISLSLKQGVGRLIRSDSDRGVMAILDSRLRTKSYGRQILNCLPPARRISDMKAIQTFFMPLGEEIQQFALVQTILQERGEQKHSYLKQMTNGEIIQRMQEIINNEARTAQQLAWLQKGLTFILEKSGAVKH